MVTPNEEGHKLVDALYQHFATGGIAPRGLDPVTYDEAILEMREKGGPWKEIEWPGHYIKFKLKELVEQYYPDDFQSYSKGKLHLIMSINSNRIWDLRFNPYGPYGGVVPYMSFRNLDELLDEFGGLGLIVANSYAEADFDGEVYEWHESLKGKSAYTRDRESDSERHPWRRKKLFFIIDVPYYYMTRKDFEQGHQKGWMNMHFQGIARQADGGDRANKPELMLHNMPPDCYLNIVNFNSDPKEFVEDWDEE